MSDLFASLGIAKSDVVGFVVVFDEILPECFLCKLGCVATNLVDGFLVETGIAGDETGELLCHLLCIVVVSSDDLDAVLKLAVISDA